MGAHQNTPLWLKFEDKFGFKPSKIKGNGISKGGTYCFKIYNEFSADQGKYIILTTGKLKIYRQPLILENKQINF